MKSVVFINPMASSRPTGMGVAGTGLLASFPEYRDGSSDAIYRFINDRVKLGALRMILRQVAADFFALKHRNRLLIFATHQGPLLRHSRCVVMVHDFIVLQNPFQSRAQTAGFLFLLPRIIRNSTLVAVISNCVRKDALRYLPSIGEKKIRVIPSISTRLDSFKKAGEEWPERLRGGRFLFVGANYLHKRLDLAIEGIIELRRRGFKVGLDIVGVSKHIWEKTYGYNFESLQEQGIEAKSYVSDEELENLYSRSMGLLFLSECEGLGFPPLEAMRKNCPVICNDTAVLRETCGDAAFFVDTNLNGSLVELIERMISGDLKVELDRKVLLGSERCMLFSRSQIIPRWQNLVQEIEKE